MRWPFVAKSLLPSDLSEKSESHSRRFAFRLFRQLTAAQHARFDAISPPPPAIWIDAVLHRAFVEVNEEGTEAAATTGVLMAASAKYQQPPTRRFEMIVDRPFFFAICDSFTSTLLFMGSVETIRR
jgi:serpin B